MPFDAYQHCPGGMNRKIKFCECGKDLLPDLNKIMDTIGGGQRAAAIAHINRLLASHTPRACLLATRGILELQAGELQALKGTAETFQQHFPDNSIALAFAAIVAAVENRLDEAVDTLQQALEKSAGVLHEATVDALAFVGQMLLANGDYGAGLVHMALHTQVSDRDEEARSSILAEMYSTPQIPLLFKQAPRRVEPPADAPWLKRFHEAHQPSRLGNWSETCRRLSELSAELPDQPAILQSLAAHQIWVNRTEQAAQTLHRLAALDGVDLNVAVEAEAMAQLLEGTDEETVDEVQYTYSVSETDRVMERLLSEKSVTQMPVDVSQLADEGSPPPRGAFWLLDRPERSTSQDMGVDDIPVVLGELYLYGRETDRAPRLQFVTVRSGDEQLKHNALASILEGFGGQLEKEEPVGEVSLEAARMSWRWRLPNDTPPEMRQALMTEKRGDLQLNVWPETPQRALGGKRPVEVAADPAYRVRLLAANLLEELGAEQEHVQFDFNLVREKLGLPLRNELDVTTNVQEVPVIDLHLLPAEKLENASLLQALGQATSVSAPRAVLRLGTEALRRPDLIAPAGRASLLGIMATLAGKTDESLDLCRQAQEAAEAAGQSPAAWLIMELEMRLATRDAQRATELLQRLQSRHRNEPGVMSALQKLFSRLGLHEPQAGPAPGARQAVPGAADAAQQGPQPAPPESGVWTPGAPPTAEQPKSKIWLPGMD